MAEYPRRREIQHRGKIRCFRLGKHGVAEADIDLHVDSCCAEHPLEPNPDPLVLGISGNAIGPDGSRIENQTVQLHVYAENVPDLCDDARFRVVRPALQVDIHGWADLWRTPHL